MPRIITDRLDRLAEGRPHRARYRITWPEDTALAEDSSREGEPTIEDSMAEGDPSEANPGSRLFVLEVQELRTPSRARGKRSV